MSSAIEDQSAIGFSKASIRRSHTAATFRRHSISAVLKLALKVSRRTGPEIAGPFGCQCVKRAVRPVWLTTRSSRAFRPSATNVRPEAGVRSGEVPMDTPWRPRLMITRTYGAKRGLLPRPQLCACLASCAAVASSLHGSLPGVLVVITNRKGTAALEHHDRGSSHRGAKWGAIIGRHRATLDAPERSVIGAQQVPSNSQLCRTTLGISFASRGSGVQSLSAPLGPNAGSGSRDRSF
jgi:hypothetical protein